MNSSILAFSSVFGINMSAVRCERLNGSVCNPGNLGAKEVKN